MHLELLVEKAARMPVRVPAAVVQSSQQRDDLDDEDDQSDLGLLKPDLCELDLEQAGKGSPLEEVLEPDQPQENFEAELALQIPYVPIAEHYALGLVYDRGQTESIVRQDLLNKWDMQFSEALSIAFAHLAEMSDYPFELVAPGVYMAPPGLDHNPAKLLLTDKVANLRLRGLPVANRGGR